MIQSKGLVSKIYKQLMQLTTMKTTNQKMDKGLNRHFSKDKQAHEKMYSIGNYSVQFSHSIMSDSLRPHESQYARPPCPPPTPGVHPDSRPSSQWCHPAIIHIYNFKTVNQFYWHFKCLLKYCPRVWNRPIKSDFWAEVRAKRWNFSF